MVVRADRTSAHWTLARCIVIWTELGHQVFCDVENTWFKNTERDLVSGLSQADPLRWRTNGEWKYTYL